jgi:hypothetical protein
MGSKIEIYIQGYHRETVVKGTQITRKLTDLREGNYKGLYQWSVKIFNLAQTVWFDQFFIWIGSSSGERATI